MSLPCVTVAPASAPFDALAETYHRVFTASCIGRAQRAQVWRAMDRTFQPGQRIPEINCGTGVDALHLAERGVTLLACDASAAMIEVAARRIRRFGITPEFSTFSSLANVSLEARAPRPPRPYSGRTKSESQAKSWRGRRESQKGDDRRNHPSKCGILFRFRAEESTSWRPGQVGPAQCSSPDTSASALGIIRR